MDLLIRVGIFAVIKHGSGKWNIIFIVIQLTWTDPDWKAYPIPELDEGWSEHVINIINPTIFMVNKKNTAFLCI